jgi:hydrogenase expression/formation protein HypC
MCVGIPGTDRRNCRWQHGHGAWSRSVASRRAVNISFIVDEGHPGTADCVGEWVLVHVGFAMSRIDEAEALATLELLQELGEMDQELDAMNASEALVVNES